MQPTICLVDAEVDGTSALLHVCGASHRSSRCTMNTKKVSSEDIEATEGNKKESMAEIDDDKK